MKTRDENAVWFFVAILAIGILGGGAVVAWGKTRGLRNNNPGNIRHSPIKWRGMSATQSDKDFVQFDGPEWGIRAMVRDLLGDFKSGQNTIRKLINEWAPPVENDTSAYVTAVARAVGIDPDARIPDIRTVMPSIVKAIIKHENGIQPYPDEIISQGISLA